MNYIIFDLEFNQALPTTTNIRSNTNSALTFEIIQIGAIKLNKNFEILSTFNNLIKPTIHKTIHPHVENLTKISNQQLDSSKSLPQIYQDFIKFIGEDESILVVWGNTDIKELLRNLIFHNLPTSYIPKKYIDIQGYASKYLKTPKGSKIGLGNAVELLNIKFQGEFHDAFNDAYYTSEVFKKIYNDNISPIIYTPRHSNRIQVVKEKVDVDGLINQFKKMYNRELSEEEKAMIKLAYTMGKTRQFIVNPADNL
ncbi:MAG: 3'-5' exonuclease [Clostridium sp.]|uniref:3'-5' exonuclease n=1 Tax=Clostridium sp. TaxID=1506 RepID=UPI00305A23C9